MTRKRAKTEWNVAFKTLIRHTNFKCNTLYTLKTYKLQGVDRYEICNTTRIHRLKRKYEIRLSVGRPLRRTSVDIHTPYTLKISDVA